MEGPRKCPRRHHRMGDGHSIEPRMELQECFIRKHETSSSRIACRVNEHSGTGAVHVIKCLLRKEIAIEHSLHDVAAREVREPVADKILGQEPAANPSILEVPTKQLLHPISIEMFAIV